MTDRRFWETCCLHLNFITTWFPASSLRGGSMFLQTSLHVRDAIQPHIIENNNVHLSVTLSVFVWFTELRHNLTSLPINCPYYIFSLFLFWRFFPFPVLAPSSFNSFLLQSNVILHTEQQALCWFSGTASSQSLYTSLFYRSAQEISLCSFTDPTALTFRK